MKGEKEEGEEMNKIDKIEYNTNWIIVAKINEIIGVLNEKAAEEAIEIKKNAHNHDHGGRHGEEGDLGWIIREAEKAGLDPALLF